jgi:TPR repeat protein
MSVGKHIFWLIGMTVLTGSLAAQTAGIDPALLAKANAGDAAAQVLLGESCAAGKGVARDLKQAAEWYKKAAEKGDLAAELHLAALYRDGGKGFPRDMDQAAAWYRKAAEQGDAGAQATLGTLYSIGQGVAQNYVEAYYWLYLAAAVKGPNQEKYAANRQLVGAHLTVDEQAEAEERAAQWLAAHPRPNPAE